MNVAKNINLIRKEKGLTQQVIADALNSDNSVVSNIENGKRELKVSELEIIAKALGVSVIDLITYPDVYVRQGNEPIEAILQVRLRKDKKEKILKMVFGEDNLEILNK
ncbi:MAG: helix-turn-helix domain-containing protein [Tannerella sp.]|jgi:transcriptional regulator with XRE-family HTH domain|nr:helix-turn-helix domain-containing protein [Tannerella sp.]